MIVALSEAEVRYFGHCHGSTEFTPMHIGAHHDNDLNISEVSDTYFAP